MVFAQEWPRYLFFDGDLFFPGGFGETIQSIFEGSGAACIAMRNADERRSGVPDSRSVHYVDSSTTPEGHMEKIWEPAVPWVTPEGDHFAVGCWGPSVPTLDFSPDTGDWCLRFEGRAEMGVLALGGVPASDRVEEAFAPLRPLPLEDALVSAIPAYIHPEFRNRLLRNYGARRGLS
jgi:hypothetical protein